MPGGLRLRPVTAITPLLDYPLEGPVYLRSSSHKLPDVVAVLKGPPSQPIEIDLARSRGLGQRRHSNQLRNGPRCPAPKAIVTLQGGRKGLFQNSTNICQGTHRATVKMDGQNGKVHDTRPELKVKCPKAHKKKGKKGPRG